MGNIFLYDSSILLMYATLPSLSGLYSQPRSYSSGHSPLILSLNLSFKSWIICCGFPDAMSKSSTYIAMYSYLFFISFNHIHGLALQCLNPSCSMMSWSLFNHLNLNFSSHIGLCGSQVYALVVLQILYQLLCILFLLCWLLCMHCHQTSMLFNLAGNIDIHKDLVETTPEEMLSIGSAVN